MRAYSHFSCESRDLAGRHRKLARAETEERTYARRSITVQIAAIDVVENWWQMGTRKLDGRQMDGRWHANHSRADALV